MKLLHDYIYNIIKLEKLNKRETTKVGYPNGRLFSCKKGVKKMLYETLTLTSGTKYDKKIKDCKSAIDFVAGELARVGASLDQEASYVLNIDLHGKPIRCRILSLGTQGKVYLNPAEIFKTALRDHASTVMLFHNHPGSEPSPSQEDIAVTKKIVEAGYLIGVPLADHIIITNDYPVTGEFFSFKTRGLISLSEYTKKYETEDADITDIDFNRKKEGKSHAL